MEIPRKKSPPGYNQAGRAREPPVQLQLKDHFGSELESSGIVGACDLAHVSTADAGIDASGIHISAELGVIPYVVGFKPQFRTQPLSKGNVLEQCQVPVVSSRTTQRVLPHIAEDRSC